MKRRDFLKVAAFAGFSDVLRSNYCHSGSASYSVDSNFDLHPFIKQHPEAVFIHLTSVDSKRDIRAIRNVGYKLAQELIVPVTSGGYPDTTKIIAKPNWTSAGPKDGRPVFEKLGVNTDPHFIEGWFQGIRKTGPHNFYIRESGNPRQWDVMGYRAMAERNGIKLRDLSTMDYWELEEGRDVNIVNIPDGAVLKKMAYMAPVNEPGTFLVNIAKMKAHGMGVTGCIKNTQGLACNRLRSFCNPHDQIRKIYDPRLVEFFQDDFEERIEELYAKHLKDGIPRWDKPGQRGGIWMEMWCQRVLDSLSVTPTGLNIMEGIYSQDGNGFGTGPHPKLGRGGVTSRDYMTNMVIFGVDPFRVDNITHWLAGHEPGNFGLFHIGIERGMSGVLDPHDIPVYIWDNNRAALTELDNFKRTPLVTYYLQRDYNGHNEPQFHICDESFDYSEWKAGKRVGDCTPSIKKLGYDKDNKLVTGLTLPEKDDVCVEVLNRDGDVIWKLHAGDLEPGDHQVVWDGFDKHGMYSFYVKGMKWDNEIKEMIYT